MTLTTAAFAWMRQASPAQRQVYLDTGSYRPGGPVDVRPEVLRRADMAKALGHRRPTSRQREARPAG